MTGMKLFDNYELDGYVQDHGNGKVKESETVVCWRKTGRRLWLRRVKLVFAGETPESKGK